jgi:hypothetical protein
MRWRRDRRHHPLDSTVKVGTTPFKSLSVPSILASSPHDAFVIVTNQAVRIDHSARVRPVRSSAVREDDQPSRRID